MRRYRDYDVYVDERPSLVALGDWPIATVSLPEGHTETELQMAAAKAAERKGFDEHPTRIIETDASVSRRIARGILSD